MNSSGWVIKRSFDKEKPQERNLIFFEQYKIPLNNDEGKIRKEYLRRMRKLLKTKLCNRNLIKRTNTWSVHFVRYLRPFIKWTREELGPMNQKTRKLMTMHKALHPRDDTDRLCVKKGRRERTQQNC